MIERSDRVALLICRRGWRNAGIAAEVQTAQVGSACVLGFADACEMGIGERTALKHLADFPCRALSCFSLDGPTHTPHYFICFVQTTPLEFDPATARAGTVSAMTASGESEQFLNMFNEA